MTRKTWVTAIVLALVAVVPAVGAAGNSGAAKLCRQGGWASLSTEAGSAFADQGGCVSYAAQGGRYGQTIHIVGGGHAAVPGGAWFPAPTATSGLPVTISIDSGSTGVCSVSGSTVSFDSLGFCLVDFTQAGNDLWAPAPEIQVGWEVISGGIG